jgi:hypothetical protein
MQVSPPTEIVSFLAPQACSIFDVVSSKVGSHDGHGRLVEVVAGLINQTSAELGLCRIKYRPEAEQALRKYSFSFSKIYLIFNKVLFFCKLQGDSYRSMASFLRRELRPRRLELRFKLNKIYSNKHYLQ